MGYESVENEILNMSQTCNITMKEKATELKEVVVKAPAIYQRGDTLSFHLSAYTTQSDYTLKDALKNFRASTWKIRQHQVPGERHLKLLH